MGFEPVSLQYRCDTLTKPSYEATEGGSWLFVGSNEPVRNECEVIYMNYFIY